MNARVHFSRIRPLLALLFVLVGATVGSNLRAQGSQLRVLFHGYVETKPRTAVGIIDGNRLSHVVDVALSRHGGEISPNGTLIAFDTCNKTNRGLNVIRIDGTEERRLTDIDGESCVQIRWSRDSTHLSYGNTLDGQLHIIDLATGVDVPLPYTSSGWHTWSPAGDAIAYHVGWGGSRAINVIDLASLRTRELVGKKRFGPCEVWAPDWSPMSDRLVFTSCRRELYVVNVDGTGLSLLAESAYAPRWAPDGTTILFLRGNRLMRVSASGGPARQLGVSPYYGGPFSIGPVR